MNELRLKRKFASTVSGSRLSLVNLESLRRRQQTLAYLSEFQTASSATPILLVEKITGTVLSGIGVFTLVATSLVCGSLLFQGPLVIELLLDLAF